MKRLILCLDGTWNKADGSHPFTNVVKIRDAVERSAGSDDGQRVYYDQGVGTGSPIDRFVGGAFGRGLGRNVRQAYKYISTHYEPGDEIFLVGFSRGAYTARSVAGYIGVSGLLRREACTSEREENAWAYYRTPKHDRAPGDRELLAPHCHENATITCVAVFDTVGALGVPTESLQWIARDRFEFHDTRLGSHIAHAYQALAIDEKRGPFEATLWEEPFNPLAKAPEVEQAWFPGAHSDVGGGYEDTSLSDVALQWMVQKLRALNVRFRHEPPRPAIAGLGPEVEPHESRSALYLVSRLRPMYRIIGGKPLPPSWRWRTPSRLEYKPIRERVHVAALELLENRAAKYRPRNLEHVRGDLGTERLPLVGWDGQLLATKKP